MIGNQTHLDEGRARYGEGFAMGHTTSGMVQVWDGFGHMGVGVDFGGACLALDMARRLPPLKIQHTNTLVRVRMLPRARIPSDLRKALASWAWLIVLLLGCLAMLAFAFLHRVG